MRHQIKYISKQDKIEKFSNEDLRNTCHYACSSLTWFNIILVMILLIIMYHLIITYINKNYR